jgi:pyridoxamine 5'-phosphate oxidase
MLSLADLRKEYGLAGMRRKDLAPDPMQQFMVWLEAAQAVGVLEPTAMTLSTATAQGVPSARTVLLKGVDGRGFLFFTNYESRKGKELHENPQASMVFHWKEQERQVCIQGSVSKLSVEESEKYFHSRPQGSQLAAWVSKQSSAVASREFLEQQLELVKQEFEGRVVPIPPYWGGFALLPVRIEFWQGRPNRLHDRFCYSLEKGRWIIERLSP